MTCRCADLVVAFELAARPQPWRRARTGKGVHFTDARTRAYETAIGYACKAKMRGPATDDDVELVCLFEQTDARRSDLDNCVKAVSDALNGVAWVDDRQVTRLRAAVVHRAPQNRVSVAVLRTVSA